MNSSQTLTDMPKSPTRFVDAALNFAIASYKGHHTNKTIVVGCGGSGPVGLAAGLSEPDQMKHLALIARYLFVKHSVDSYILIMPAYQDDEEVLAVEVAVDSGRWHCVACIERDIDGRFTGLGESAPCSAMQPLIEDLLAHGHSIPGIMRRELDNAYDALKIDCGDLCRSRDDSSGG